MKILVFEYITGGGFNKQALPGSLAREGRLMLQALLDNLAAIDGIELVVMLDERLVGSVNTGGATATIKPENDVTEEFSRLVEQCDAVWPVAPEFDGILQALCQMVAQSGRILLTSPANAVALTGNKLRTYERLLQHDIATVATRLLDTAEYRPGEWIVKSIDGVGCAESYLIEDQQDFAAISSRLQNKTRFIFQPHIQGEKTSLSCLFNQGQGWLLCVNLQCFEIINKQYQLTECLVNYRTDFSPYRDLVQAIAQAFPELWGYVGIDLIETAEQIYVLEINPRLTTSFTGIYDGLGVNVAEQVLQLLNGEPRIHPVRNQSIAVKVRESDAV
ncbi:ATP-grasp domain-containing protein [Methylobacter sp. YRD-M1]|uniref:ATP-grasp domain-containing protein n=1 Tax=Methylobacter sp. YRD-M1 TaxID=2911520 RepID=UPI00227A5834|nr:ATP-grasp domain-containing protein [Methylobacter sp. YRD-M1]WAK03966.1 ATP-grasp domain-containing protein [Methylobacter sp. YRD-M1]